MQTEAGTSLSPPPPDRSLQTGVPRERSRRLFLLVLSVATLWVATDQVTKNLAVQHLSDGGARPLVGELLRLNLTFNPGAAFSMGTGATGLLTILAITVGIVIIWNARKLGSLAWAWGLGLLLGGAVGNLCDRLFRPPGPGRGHVVDFFQLPNFPIFNVADIGITSAAVLICLLALRGINPDGTRVRDEKAAAAKGESTDPEPAGEHAAQPDALDPESTDQGTASDTADAEDPGHPQDGGKDV